MQTPCVKKKELDICLDLQRPILANDYFLKIVHVSNNLLSIFGHFVKMIN